MTIIARFSATLLLVAVVCFAQLTMVGQALGASYLGSFPFYSGDYPYYEGPYPPNPLYAPYGFYGCRGGCCRQAVWRRRHWHSVIACYPVPARPAHPRYFRSERPGIVR